MLIEYLKDFIRNKSVLILGFGREGRSTYELLKKIQGYKELSVADLNEITDIDEKVFCGTSYQESIGKYDIVFKSPGVVLENLAFASKIVSQTDIMIKVFGKNIIGVTGTKGKSTTTSLIYHILKSCGKNPILVGNIGIPAFDEAQNAKPDSLFVYELSCHQLEFATCSPHRGVLLNIYPEHLDHYGLFERYKSAKENIYRNMQAGDLLVCGKEVEPCDFDGEAITVSMTNNEADYVASESGFKNKIGVSICEKPQCKILGVHNMYNIAVAFAICSDCGVSQEEFFDALKDFNPLPHRLELFAEIDGVKYFDDSISTIPETAIKALDSVKNVGSILLGGMDRGIDLSGLIDYLINNPVEHVILMPDTGKIIYEKLKGIYGGNIYLTEGLEEAVMVAKKVTPKGTACVLSPAAASYGFFKNFEHRGEVFKELVLKR